MLLTTATTNPARSRPINSKLLLESLNSFKGEDQNPQQQVERLILSVSGAQTQLEGIEVATKDAYRRSNHAGDLIDVLKLPIKDATDDTKRTDVRDDGAQALQLTSTTSALLKKNKVRLPSLVARSNQLLQSLFGASHDLSLLLGNVATDHASLPHLQKAQVALSQAASLYQESASEIAYSGSQNKRAVASLPALEADLYRVAADRPQSNVSSAASDALASARRVEIPRISSSLSLERAIQTGGGTSGHLTSVEASLRQALASLQS